VPARQAPPGRSARDGFLRLHEIRRRGRAFAEAGAAVVLTDTNEQALSAATEELTAAGHQALGVNCDVSHEDQVAALVERTVDTFDRLDMALNNAGIMVPPSDAADEPAENFDRVTAIKLRGVWACMKHELRQMHAQAAAPSSTARRSAASSETPAAPPTTRPNTLPKAFDCLLVDEAWQDGVGRLHALPPGHQPVRARR
jgi:NAD(P)-dependent dehydrogenase (short-subunit alcohol dehydrogenase family)